MKASSAPHSGAALIRKRTELIHVSGNCLCVSRSNLLIIPGCWFYKTHFQGKKLRSTDWPKRTGIQLRSHYLQISWTFQGKALTCICNGPSVMPGNSPCLPPWPKSISDNRGTWSSRRGIRSHALLLTGCHSEGPAFCDHKRWRLNPNFTPFFPVRPSPKELLGLVISVSDVVSVTISPFTSATAVKFMLTSFPLSTINPLYSPRSPLRTIPVTIIRVTPGLVCPHL